MHLTPCFLTSATVCHLIISEEVLIFHCTLVSSWALARLSTAMAKNTLSRVSEEEVKERKPGGRRATGEERKRKVKRLNFIHQFAFNSNQSGLLEKRRKIKFAKLWGRIQLPKSVRTMKKMEKTIPLSLTPPWDSMPSYITMFQSSPVRICKEKQNKAAILYI